MTPTPRDGRPVKNITVRLAVRNWARRREYPWELVMRVTWGSTHARLKNATMPVAV